MCKTQMFIDTKKHCIDRDSDTDAIISENYYIKLKNKDINFEVEVDANLYEQCGEKGNIFPFE